MAVAVYPLVTCGQCRYCHSNQHQVCPSRKLFGLDVHGALAEYISVPQECLFPMPAGRTYLEGALTEPFANALHVLERCSGIEGKTGLIYGAGSIGLLVYLAARHLGAKRLAVVDHNPYRLETVRRLGADLVVNSEEQDPVKTILDWSQMAGVDFSVDAVGETVCRKNAMTCTAPKGTMVMVGLVDDLCEIDARLTITRELALKGSYAYTRENFAQALSFIEQRILPTESFVSEALLDQGQQIFEELTSRRSQKTKVIFRL
jgi:threonine dehydrogenase-like Zn-dependent dehydrogenase